MEFGLDPSRSSGVAVMNRARTVDHLQLGDKPDPSFHRRMVPLIHPLTVKQDVIYGRKFGTALTMDIFTPKKDAKGVGVIIVVSGGFFSSHESISPALCQATDRSRLHCLRCRPRQPTSLHDPGDHPGYEPGRAVHSLSRQGLRDRPRPHWYHRSLGRRSPVADAGNRRRSG